MSRDAYSEWLDRLDEEERISGQSVDPRDRFDEALAERDRLREKGDAVLLVARQPHPRERREHRTARDEHDARLELYPDRPVDSQVSPLGRRAA